MLEAVKNEIERESFRAHVGRQIFCRRGCPVVLDVRKAIAVYVWVDSDIVFSRVFCGACFDFISSNGGLTRGVKAAGDGATLETYDGRHRWFE